MEADACIDDLSPDSQDEAPHYLRPWENRLGIHTLSHSHTAAGYHGVTWDNILSAVICHTSCRLSESSSLHSPRESQLVVWNGKYPLEVNFATLFNHEITLNNIGVLSKLTIKYFNNPRYGRIFGQSLARNPNIKWNSNNNDVSSTLAPRSSGPDTAQHITSTRTNLSISPVFSLVIYCICFMCSMIGWW